MTMLKGKIFSFAQYLNHANGEEQRTANIGFAAIWADE